MSRLTIRCCRLVNLSGHQSILRRTRVDSGHSCRLAHRLGGRKTRARLTISRFRTHVLLVRDGLLRGSRLVKRGRHTVTYLLNIFPFRVEHVDFRRLHRVPFPLSSNIPTGVLALHPSMQTTRVRLLTSGTSMVTTGTTFCPSLILNTKNNFGDFSLNG